MLFENNYNFYDSNNKMLENISNGFIKGNMFTNEYIGYKNYIPKQPKIANEKDKDLYYITELSFAINDLNLYLDLNPSDKEMFKTYKELIKKLNILTDQYKEKYNSLTLNQETKLYDWIKDIPWKKDGDATYV